MGRRHHYVPRFHLNRFVDEDVLFVYDLHEGTSRKSRPEAAACENDSYRIHVPDMAPDALEIALSDIESAASLVLSLTRTILRIHRVEKISELQNH